MNYIDKRLSDRLREGFYDFIDFGCSKGGSLEYGMKRLGGVRGVGVDISPDKVATSKAAGYDAFIADATKLDMHVDSVSFVTMIDFLEHMPSKAAAAACVASAAKVARDFIYIRQPWFDSDGYLFARGLKLYWSDWDGHPNAMSSLETYEAVSRLPEIGHFRIYGYRRIVDSSDDAVHPLSSPMDQDFYDPAVHPPKLAADFDVPVFQQLICVAAIRGGARKIEDVEGLGIKWTELIFDSKSSPQ